MTDKEIHNRVHILWNLVDKVTLSLNEVDICNDMVLEKVSKVGSLDESASEDLRLNAYNLIYYQNRLNYASLKILENVYLLRKAADLLNLIVCELRTGKKDDRFDELYQEVFGGDSDD